MENDDNKEERFEKIIEIFELMAESIKSDIDSVVEKMKENSENFM